MKFEQFASMKKSIFSRKEDKKIKFSDINISPYPNVENETMYRISFMRIIILKTINLKGIKSYMLKLIAREK